MAVEYEYVRAAAPSTSPTDRPHLLGEGLSLRAPRPDETGRLYEVYLDAFSTRTSNPLDDATWKAKWPLHPQCVLRLSCIAFSDRRAIAYLLSYVDEAGPDEGIIGQLGVRVRFRRNGLGRALIDTALSAFARAGIATASLRVAPDNTDALRLYESMGFQRRVRS